MGGSSQDEQIQVRGQGTRSPGNVDDLSLDAALDQPGGDGLGDGPGIAEVGLNNDERPGHGVLLKGGTGDVTGDVCVMNPLSGVTPRRTQTGPAALKAAGPVRPRGSVGRKDEPGRRTASPRRVSELGGVDGEGVAGLH